MKPVDNRCRKIPLFIGAKTQKLNNGYGLTSDSWLTQIIFHEKSKVFQS